MEHTVDIDSFTKLFSKNLSRLGIHYMSTIAVLARYAAYQSLIGKEITRELAQKAKGGTK